MSRIINLKKLSIAREDLLDAKFTTKPSIKSYLSNAIFRVTLFINNYDLMRVYKLEEKFYANPRFKIYSKLKMKTSEFDLKRKKLAKIIKIYTTYYLIKSTQLAFLQFYSRSLRTPDEIEEMWFDVNVIESISKMIGNPLSELADISFLIYFFSSFSTYLFITVLPEYYSDYPFDSNFLRFFLYPEMEVKRADLTIQETIIDLLSSINFLKLRRIKEKCSNLKNNNESLAETKTTHKHLWSNLESYRHQLTKYKENSWKLRSKTYSRESFSNLHNEAAHLIFLPYCMTFTWLVIGLPYLFIIGSIDRCRLLNLKDCRLIDVYSISDFIFSLELTIMMLFCLFTYTLHLILFGLLAKNQLDLVECIREDLIKFLKKLRHINSCRYTQNDCEFHENEEVSIQKKINRKLLKTLVKVLVTLDDLQRGARTLTEVMAAHIINGLILTITLFLTEGMRMQEHRFFIQQNLITNWMIVNMLALVCAHIYANYSSIEKLYWTIMAETIIKVDNYYLVSDLVIQLLHKLAYSSHTTKSFYSVKPFGVVLTFEKTLELNFIIVSMYSLARAP